MKLTPTLNYYNENAEEFTASTINVDFTNVQDKFLNKLASSSSILDFGCGAGRDTKYFLEKGYIVEAIDGSDKLCKLASEYTGIEVKHSEKHKQILKRKMMPKRYRRKCSK